VKNLKKPYKYKTNKFVKNDIKAYLKSNEEKSILRFITCGSVDDGKSTLIGRLLYDSKMIYEDHFAQLENDSKKVGTQGQKIDFSLLVDGLAAEREQGITIDVAYRFFSTEKRKFIVADTPGHEQYTRNMVTGASTAVLAVILIDARKGVLTQTRRHTFLCHLLGIKKFILVINKMDLINYSKSIYDNNVAQYKKFISGLGIKNFISIPVSALEGDNVKSSSRKMSWYKGNTLISYLENIKLNDDVKDNEDNFIMPVQWVNRPNLDFRGFSGTIVSGIIKPGKRVTIMPSKKTSIVDRIVTFDGDLNEASTSQSVTLTLRDHIDCSRGQIIMSSNSELEEADQFDINLIWMNEVSLVPGRSYYLKIGSQTVSATIQKPKYKINVNTMEHIATKTLKLNEIGVSCITTDRPILFASYSSNRALGSFIIIDKLTNFTVAAGMINFSLYRSQNIHWQTTEITPEYRANLKNQKPVVLWMTGLSGSGKSTIANAVEKRLANMNRHTFLLDGDNIRHGLNKDLGFTDACRIENIRRIGEVAKLMIDAGLIVITAFISPFRQERQIVREMMKSEEFIEIYIDTPINIAEKRDIKGLYKKARSGQIKNFTGIDSPYEPPEKPEIHIETTKMTIDEAANKIIESLIDEYI
tara:strand:+ start:2521 stop:4446 length:1926 start_codon:yes stop_codon:yes gene_type:complete